MSEPGFVITRRAFLEGVGIGAVGLGLGLFPRRADAAAPASTRGLRPNVFVHIASDGLVTIVCARSEMGQGVRSTIPALLADELGADMARVTIVQGDADKRYGDQKTDGSTSIRNGYEPLRKAGATARTMLVAGLTVPLTCRVHAVSASTREDRTTVRRSITSATLPAAVRAARSILQRGSPRSARHSGW